MSQCCETQEWKEKEKETIEKYQDLRTELRRLCEIPVEVVVPIIIGALGTISESLKK